MPDDSSAEPIERWTAKRRATLALSILKGDKDQHGQGGVGSNAHPTCGWMIEKREAAVSERTGG